MSCRVLKLARAPYYRWLREPVGPAGRLRGERIAALRQAHEDDAEFGYRLLADEARQAGFPMADRTAWRLCQQSGIMSAIVKTRKKRGKKPGPPVCDDLVKRNFTAASPDLLWLVDITEHWTKEGKLYLCAIKDGRFQGANATLLMSSFSFSRGVWNPSVLRGRSLSWSTIASIASSGMLLKLVPFG